MPPDSSPSPSHGCAMGLSLSLWERWSGEPRLHFPSTENASRTLIAFPPVFDEPLKPDTW